jgi:chromate transporter
VTQAADTSIARAEPPKLGDLFVQFLLIGAISFGGGIMAYERILLVDKRKWLSSDEFMAYLAISQTMPGLNSVNMAVLSGDHLRGSLGSLVASIGLIMPGSLFLLCVGALFASASDHPLVNLTLIGIAAAASGLLAAITYRIGEDNWRHLKSLLIIVATFLLMSIANLSLPAVLLIMTPIAIYLYRPRQST